MRCCTRLLHVHLYSFTLSLLFLLLTHPSFALVFRWVLSAMNTICPPTICPPPRTLRTLAFLFSPWPPHLSFPPPALQAPQVPPARGQVQWVPERAPQGRACAHGGSGHTRTPGHQLRRSAPNIQVSGPSMPELICCYDFSSAMIQSGDSAQKR